MNIKVHVPKLTETAAGATILSWHKKPGDPVSRNETIVCLETDRVIIEIPAQADGILDRIAVSDGDAVQAGDLLAVINMDEVTCTERKKSSHETVDQAYQRGKADAEKAFHARARALLRMIGITTTD